MPIDLRTRIRLLMDEQAAEAEQPASYATLRGRSDEQPEVPDSSVDDPEDVPVPENPPIDAPETQETPQESIEAPEPSDTQSVAIDAPEPLPEPERAETPEPDHLPEPPPPDDVPVDDWEPPVEAQVDEPEFMEVPESEPAGQHGEPEMFDPGEEFMREMAMEFENALEEANGPAEPSWQDEQGWQAALVDRMN